MSKKEKFQFEKRGFRSDKDMINLKKSLLDKLITSKPCMIFFMDGDKANLVIEGDTKEISIMISESMLCAKKFRDIIFGAIEMYQGKLN